MILTHCFPLQLQLSQQTMFVMPVNPETKESWKKLEQEMKNNTSN